MRSAGRTCATGSTISPSHEQRRRTARWRTVVDDEARGRTRIVTVQDGLRGALPDGPRIRRARSAARWRGGRPPGRRRCGTLPTLHRRAQVRDDAAQMGLRSRRPRGAASDQDRSPHYLARVASPRRPRGAATAPGCSRRPATVDRKRNAIREAPGLPTRVYTISSTRTRRSRSSTARTFESWPDRSAMLTARHSGLARTTKAQRAGS